MECNTSNNNVNSEAAPENKELRDLGTHMAGATSLHETIETGQPVQINPPAGGQGSYGMYDPREDRFDGTSSESKS